MINKTEINKEDLLNIMDTLIIKNSTMRENNIGDIINNLDAILNNNVFKHSLSDARNNWLDISVNQVINNVIDYFKSMETVQL